MRILFIGNSRIGDFVLASGLLGHLLDTHPQARFTVVCGPAAAALVAAMPRLDRLIVLRKRRFHRHWLDLWLATAGTGWDIVVDLRNSAVSRLLRAGVRFRQGRTSPRGHRVEAMAAVLGLTEPAAPRVWLSDGARAAAADLVPPGGPVLAVAPGSTHLHKQWPAERFVDLADRLTGPGGILPGARVAVIGAEEERPAAAPLLAALGTGRAIDLVGRRPLDTVAACLERSTFFVGNDGGLMHIAAAVGIPTLGLFGPTPAGVYGPWGDRSAAVLSAEPYAALRAELERGLAAGHEDARSLMLGLSVEMAEAAARGLWERA